MRIAKSFTFESAHMIVGHPRCGQVHGHTWHLTVYAEDYKLNKEGMILDFSILGGVVKMLLAKLDHKMINEVLAQDEMFRGGLPITAETLVIWITRQLETGLDLVGCNPVSLTCRLQEGPGGWAEYTLGEVIDYGRNE